MKFYCSCVSCVGLFRFSKYSLRLTLKKDSDIHETSYTQNTSINICVSYLIKTQTSNDFKKNE